MYSEIAGDVYINLNMVGWFIDYMITWLMYDCRSYKYKYIGGDYMIDLNMVVWPILYKFKYDYII
jgi:hypothetical protein